MAKYLIPGSAHIDNMRRLLSKLEFEFMDPSIPPNPVDISVLLTGIENERGYMEGAIAHELSTIAGAEIDISQL